MNISSRILYAGAGLLLAGLVAVYIYWYPAAEPVDSPESEILLRQGIALFQQKKYTETLQELGQIPGNAVDWRVRYYQGSAHLMLRNYEAAIDSLEQASVLNDRESRILYALGVVYFKLGKIKLAKGYFASALEVNPDDENARGLLNTMSKIERKGGAVEVPVHGSSRNLSKAPVQTAEQGIGVKSPASTGNTDTPAGDLIPAPTKADGSDH
jgi:tetratricopeptide (TPR) repeat protein